MKLVLALILAVAAVDARSYIPKKVYEETYFDKTKYDPTNVFDKKVEYDTNEVVPFGDADNKPYYYRYFFPGTYGYKKYSPFQKETKYEGEFVVDKTNDFFYDTKEKYDFDTFVRYFTSQPIFAALTKYFPTNKGVEGEFKNEQKYYAVPKEVVELARTSKDLRETIRTIVKYYYNLPNDVKAAVAEKYDFENVVRFLLQVYYDIPNVSNGLTNYYDIPASVYAELKTQYDLRAVIGNVVSKFYELTPFERQYYTERFFDIPAVVRTLVKVYYGVPQFDKYDVEYYYYDTEFLRKFSEEFTKKYDFNDVVEKIFERRNSLSEKEREFYDRFFNFEEYVKFLVKTYYYTVYENTKTFETNEYTKKSFFDFLGKIYKQYYGYSYNKDFAGEDYPFEYYFNKFFGNKRFVPTTETGFNNKGYFPYNYNQYGKSDVKGLKAFFESFFGGYPYGSYGSNYPTVPEYYPRPYNYYGYPEGKYDEYYGKQTGDFFGDYYNPGYGYGYNYNESPFNYFYGKKNFGVPKFYPGKYYENTTPKGFNFEKFFGNKKYTPFPVAEGEYYKNVETGYGFDKYFGGKFDYPVTRENNFEKFFKNFFNEGY